MNHGTDTLINALMIIAMFIGFFQIKHLDFIMIKDSMDSTMLLTSFGMLAYSIFTIISGILHSDNFGPLIVTNGIFELIEVQIQLLFIADLKHKRLRPAASEATEAAEKPGRQVLTFLLVCNLGLWITYNFEMQKLDSTPGALEFYGKMAWIVIQRITLPLCVFFRFHSTVVLSELWKDVYKKK